MQIQISVKRIFKLLGYCVLVAYIGLIPYILYQVLWSVNANRVENFQNHVELYKQQQQLCQKDSSI